MKIGNAPVLVLPNSCRLGQVSDTKFGTNVSNKMLLNAAKFQDYSFTFSELLRENQQEGGERGLNYKIKNPRNEHEILTN